MCDCFANFGICIMILLPIADLVVLGNMIFDAGQCESCFCAAVSLFVPILGLYKVLKSIEVVREKHNIQGDCCSDFMKLIFCGPLFLTQVRAQQERGMGEDIERV